MVQLLRMIGHIIIIACFVELIDQPSAVVQSKMWQNSHCPNGAKPFCMAMGMGNGGWGVAFAREKNRVGCGYTFVTASFFGSKKH